MLYAHVYTQGGIIPITLTRIANSFMLMLRVLQCCATLVDRSVQISRTKKPILVFTLKAVSNPETRVYLMKSLT